MDMQKEKEAFANWFGACFTNGKIEFDADGVPIGYEKAIAWKAWKAAKAQAIPEGFVLVPKEPSADLVNHGHQVFLGHFNEGGQTSGRSLYFAYKAMIEAQELAND